CNTCHQGVPKPMSIPAITLGEKKPEMMAGEAAGGKTMSATGNPAADGLLDGYLSAAGGAGALEKNTNPVAKGAGPTSAGRSMPVDIYAKAPDKRVSVVHTKDGDSVTAYNGKVGWLALPQRVHMMNAQESFGAKMDADLAFPANVKGMYSKWETK